MCTIDNHFWRKLKLLSTATFCSALRHTAQHYDVLLSTTTYRSALRHTAQRYDVPLGTATYRSALRRTAQHYAFYKNWCCEFIWVWSEISGEFSDRAESHIGISARPEKSSEIRPGPKVRDENSLGRNSCNSPDQYREREKSERWKANVPEHTRKEKRRVYINACQ
jgi:hypothetical protein